MIITAICYLITILLCRFYFLYIPALYTGSAIAKHTGNMFLGFFSSMLACWLAIGIAWNALEGGTLPMACSVFCMAGLIYDSYKDKEEKLYSSKTLIASECGAIMASNFILALHFGTRIY